MFSGGVQCHHDAYIFHNGGFLIRKDSDVAADVRNAIERAKARHGTDELLKLHKDGNLYNLYLEQRSDIQEANASYFGSESPNEQQVDP